MARTIILEIPSRTDHLALVRRVVATAASAGDILPDRRIDDLSLAVSEACANAIDAQRPGGSTQTVLVTVELDEDAVAVTVTDHAGGFVPEELDPLPSVDDPGRLRHERGLGVPLMRSLADQVTFTATVDGTEVRITVEG
ncbi:MAG: ATP-binding protein [Actinomycetota bacterium]|nr:ATP-binding protein [Actinomycetota bacterium]